MNSAVTENRRDTRGLRVPAGVAVALAAVSVIVGVASAAPSEPEPLAAIAATAQTYIRTQLPAGANIESVRADSLDPRLRLPHCAEPLRASLPTGATLQARTTVGVQCAGPSGWTVYIPVTIESRVTVLVLRRAVSHDVHLLPDDVSVESRKVAGAAAAFLTDPRELGGRTLRRPLPAGTTLTVDMFKPDIIVHRGQTVTLIAATGSFEVRASGLALADAEIGARLKVENLSSQKVVEGVVESSGTIRVAW